MGVLRMTIYCTLTPNRLPVEVCPCASCTERRGLRRLFQDLRATQVQDEFDDALSDSVIALGQFWLVFQALERTVGPIGVYGVSLEQEPIGKDMP